MNDKKLKVCIFLHYSGKVEIPYYVKLYVTELSRHFDLVYFLSNNKSLKNENSPFDSKVKFKYYENRGYDFGMFYRFIIGEDLEKYEQLAIVNDSNFLVKKLDSVFKWAQKTDADFWGLVDSIENPHFSTHKNNYHIQSHFIVLNKKAIDLFPNFLKTLNADEILKETDLKKLRHNVINHWEIGLSQYFIKHNLKIASFINSQSMIKKYRPKKVNVTFSLFHELIVFENYPVLKRKIATTKWKWYKFKMKRWRETLLNYGEKKWDMEKICQMENIKL